MATMAPQSTVVMTSATPAQSDKIRNYRKIIYGLAVTEIVLGSLSMLLGVVITAVGGSGRSSTYYSSYSGYTYRYTYRSFSVGEGLWCGIWILVAGSIGVPASRTQDKACLINCHMGFAITAAIFAFIQGITSSTMAALYGSSLLMGLSSFLAFVGFASFVICIVSACYCCPLYTAFTGAPNCCGNCCCDSGTVQQPVGQQTVYVQQPNTQVQYQQTQIPPQGVQQQYVVQHHP
uniref:MARVEL domain-containing protein n=1 Tax=Ciona savignyi TaxID=51511 RepID=H2YGU5_CIOSA